MQEFNMKGKLKQQEIDSMADKLSTSDEKQGMFNPFARRGFQPQTIWDTKGDDAPQPIAKTKNDPSANTPKAEDKKETQQKPLMLDDEERKNVVTSKHKAAKLDIDVLISPESDKMAVPSIAIFDSCYKPGKAEKSGKIDNTMSDVVSFQDWKLKYSSSQAKMMIQ